MIHHPDPGASPNPTIPAEDDGGGAPPPGKPAARRDLNRDCPPLISRPQGARSRPGILCCCRLVLFSSCETLLSFCRGVGGIDSTGSRGVADPSPLAGRSPPTLQGGRGLRILRRPDGGDGVRLQGRRANKRKRDSPCPVRQLAGGPAGPAHGHMVRPDAAQLSGRQFSEFLFLLA